jgi:hypothetical protein
MEVIMEMIEEMLTGQIGMDTFIEELTADSSLQNTISELVPPAAIGNPNHELWNTASYCALEKYNFDLYKLLVGVCKFDGSLGENLNIFSTIKMVYSFINPDLEYTSIYTDSYRLYLDAIGEWFEGPEVDSVVENIILEALKLKTKKQRIIYAKAAIISAFHVEDKKPIWIQGGEWPMGKHSPMKFLSKKRKGEEVYYYFEDVDTGEKRTVIQMY